MANNKHKHIRYNILDYCFRNKSFDINELLDYLNEKIAKDFPGEGIGIDALKRDLMVFRNKTIGIGFNAPLPRGTIYKYSDPNFSIAKRPLLEEENALIYTAQKLLERFENHPKYNRLSEAFIKFQDEEEQGNDSSRILFYDNNEEYKGIKYLKPLYLAIKKKEVLSIKYKGFKNESSSVFEFHPHVLKQYNRRWFVYGYNKTKKIKKWSIPLDERLISFNILEDTKYIESDSDWDTFFRTMVGVTRKQSKIEKVVLKFYNQRENYFKTKPFIPDFEEFFEEDKQDQIWFNAIINQELIQQILSYGQDVEVLEPKDLRQQIKTHINSLQNYY